MFAGKGNKKIKQEKKKKQKGKKRIEKFHNFNFRSTFSCFTYNTLYRTRQ